MVSWLGLGPVGLCAVQGRRSPRAPGGVVAVDTVGQRLEVAWRLGAEPVHLTKEDPRAAVKALTEGRGADATIDAVGHPDALQPACRLTRKAGTVSGLPASMLSGVEVHMGIVWIKALTLKTWARERDQARRPGAR